MNVACGQSLFGLGRRHAGTDAKSAGFVRGGGDHAAILGLPRNNYRLISQLWIERLLYRGKEGVQINVENAAGHTAIID